MASPGEGLKASPVAGLLGAEDGWKPDDRTRSTRAFANATRVLGLDQSSLTPWLRTKKYVATSASRVPLTATTTEADESVMK